jgi:23S rRNA (guanosine2251-2'-O)-methyltransferase
MTKNNNSLWIFGTHCVFAALKNGKRKIFQILITKNSLAEFDKFAKDNNFKNLRQFVKIVDNAQIERIVGQNQAHQGFALNCSFLDVKNEENLFAELNDKVILILDELTDPHNVGAIIRSAAAFGVKKVVFPQNNFAKESSIMNKSSAGMIENVELFEVVNVNKMMERLKKHNYWCFGLAGEAQEEISVMKKYDKVALIVGSEGKGIRPLVKKNCDVLVRIPISDKVESLNASVACAVALYEIGSVT